MPTTYAEIAEKLPEQVRAALHVAEEQTTRVLDAVSDQVKSLDLPHLAPLPEVGKVIDTTFWFVERVINLQKQFVTELFDSTSAADADA